MLRGVNPRIRDLHSLASLIYFKELYLPFRAHTRVWQKWRLSAPQTHLWLIKVWFSASTFVV
jgi:hypothetical protein